MPKLLLLALGVILALSARVAAPASRAAAQAPPAVTVVSEEPRNEFPSGVTFALTFATSATVKEVRLRYELAPDGTGATAVATCTTAAATSCTYTLTSGRGIFIIPGAEITYHWDVTDASGGTFSTQDRVYVHQDTRFTFKTLQSGNITLYYHQGSEAAARAVLNAAADVIEKDSALEKTQITFPVKIFLYTTAEEMQPAIAPGGTGRGVTVLGEVVYSDTAMVSADVQTLDITRHEVAHIVTREATKGPFGVPPWLNEGISVFSQSQPLSGHANALQAAIDSDDVLTMKELTSSATGSVASTVGLYYGQAGSIVKFLVDTYGAEKFAALLKTFKDGSTPDKAFQAIYGFDGFGLENAWRKSVGLQEHVASATPTPRAAPTSLALATSPASQPAASSGGGTNTAAVAVIVGLAVLVLVAAGTAIVIIRRRA